MATFERRVDALRRLLDSGEHAQEQRRQEWRRLFANIMAGMDASDVGEATRGAVAERYSHLPQEERDDLVEQLLETFAWWAVVDMEQIRHDRRNLIPPILREA